MGGFTPVPRTDPTVHTGVRDTYNVGSRIVDDVFPEVLMRDPNAAPLTVITSLLRKTRTVSHYKFDVFEKDLLPRRIVIAAAVTSGATSITASTGQGARAAVNYVFMNTRTREHVLVTAVSTDTLTVTRGIGGVQDAMDAGDVLDFQRPVFVDGASKGTYKSTKEDTQYNYCEIIRTGFGFTRRDAHTAQHGGKDPAMERKAQGVEHAISIEKSGMFGRRHSLVDATSGRLQTFAGGLEFFIKSNVWDLNNTTPTLGMIYEFLETAMTYGDSGNRQGNGSKYLLASPRWLSLFVALIDNQIRYVNPQTREGVRIGLKIGVIDSPHGELKIIRHPLLVGDHADMAFMLDLNHVRKVVFEGGDTKLLRDREDPSVDGSEEEYLSDIGWQIDLEDAHGIWRGLPLAS